MVGLALTRPVFLLAGLLIVPAVIVFLRADRGESGKRKLASLILRCLLIAVLTCALSGPTASSGEPEVDVVFAVDHSDSVPEKTRIDALEVIAEAAAGGSGGPSRRVRTGLVVFGREPSVESAPGSFTGATRVESYVEGSSTNIESAVLTSLAIMGSGRALRIILLSDGNETAGDALTAAKTARAAGAAVYPVMLSGVAEGNEIVVEGMTAPRTSAVSQTHELTLLVSSTEQASARVSIFRDGEYLGEDDLDLSPGMNAFSYRAAVDEPGIHSYEAYVESFQDTFIRNNTNSC